MNHKCPNCGVDLYPMQQCRREGGLRDSYVCQCGTWWYEKDGELIKDE